MDSQEPKPWYINLLEFIASKLTESKLKDSGVDGRTVTMSKQFDWTGFDATGEDMARAAVLKMACEAALADKYLEASDIDGDGDLDTKCNFGLQQIAGKVGCSRFNGKRANDIHAMCLSDPGEFENLLPDRAILAAKRGGLVVASLPNPSGSGHVAVVYPTSGGESASLGRVVPMVANIGKFPNGVKAASAAFPVKRFDEICWFLWKPSLA